MTRGKNGRKAPQSYQEIIERCGGFARLAPAIGIEYETAKKWFYRDYIPDKYGEMVIDAAPRGSVKPEDFLRLAALRLRD